MKALARLSSPYRSVRRGDVETIHAPENRPTGPQQNLSKVMLDWSWDVAMPMPSANTPERNRPAVVVTSACTNF